MSDVLTRPKPMGFSHEPRHSEQIIWLTPPYILEALGGFDLDPCAAPDPKPWATADTHYTLPTDGLAEPWFGRVWCNPPYGDQTWAWLEKLAEHGRGTALIFARTETRGFHAQVWEKATAILFLKGRVCFYKSDGSRGGRAGAPSCLVAYGLDDARRLQTIAVDGSLEGFLVWPGGLL